MIYVLGKLKSNSRVPKGYIPRSQHNETVIKLNDEYYKKEDKYKGQILHFELRQEKLIAENSELKRKLAAALSMPAQPGEYKTCRACGASKPLSAMMNSGGYNKDGKPRKKNLCNHCAEKRRAASGYYHSQRYKNRRKKAKELKGYTVSAKFRDFPGPSIKISKKLVKGFINKAEKDMVKLAEGEKHD